jgi:hypothetical protein
MKQVRLISRADGAAMGISALAADVREKREKGSSKCHGADGKGGTKMGKQ